jgi:ATP-dependent Clp protease ATP-binding subunit ClpA
VVVFRQLNRDDMKKIIDIELEGVRVRLSEKEVDLVLDDAAKERIIDEGSDFEYGARPLKRAIEKLVEDPLSERVLRGEVPPHSRVNVTTKDGILEFVTEAQPAPASAGAGETKPQ